MLPRASLFFFRSFLRYCKRKQPVMRNCMHNSLPTTLIKCHCQIYLIQNEAYLKNTKPTFQTIWAEGADKEGSARKQCMRIKKKYTVHSLSPQRLLRIHYIIQNGHSEPYDIAVIELHANFPVCLK